MSCRLCRDEIESISHLTTCRILAPLFSHIETHTKTKLPDTQHRLFGKGLSKSGRALFLLVWKFILITLIEWKIGAPPPNTDAILKSSWRTLIIRIKAYVHKFKLADLTSTHRPSSKKVSPLKSTTKPSPLEKANGALAPLASLTEDHELQWSQLVYENLEQLDLLTFAQRSLSV